MSIKSWLKLVSTLNGWGCNICHVYYNTYDEAMACFVACLQKQQQQQ